MLISKKAYKSNRLHNSFDYKLRRKKYMGKRTQDKENMQACPCLQNKTMLTKQKQRSQRCYIVCTYMSSDTSNSSQMCNIYINYICEKYTKSLLENENE